MPPLTSRIPHTFRLAVPALLSLLLAACGGMGGEKRVSYDPETFDSTTAHTRTFEASEAQTCEAARRALLSQGYMITAANSELATGRKSFQPANEVHVEVEFRVVCARDTAAGKGAPPTTIAFVSALQDRYSLKKVNNSASVGVGMLGSVSLPYSSSDDAMVKVASQTVTDERFYERFYDLVQRFLVVEAPVEAPAAPSSPAAPVSKPATSMPVPAPAVPTAPVAPPADVTAPTVPPRAPGPAAPAEVAPTPPAPPAAGPEAAPAAAPAPTPPPAPAPEPAPTEKPPADTVPVAPSPSRG